MTNFNQTFFSERNYFRGHSVGFLFRKGFSEFYHYLCLLFFNDKIRSYQRKNFIKNFSSDIPLVLHSPFNAIFTSISRIKKAAKCLMYPLHHFFICIHDLKSWPIINPIFLFNFLNIKSSFSICKSSKIRNLFFSPHMTSFGRIISYVRLIVYRKRLNEKTQKGCDSLNIARKAVRDLRRVNPAIEIWSVGIAKPKVTECLNEASRLLAENMAQTIDEVTRDVLASTSSVLQCSNGVNGNTPTELTKADIDSAVKTLLGNDADMISEVVVGRDAFGTAPVRPAFWAYLDTDLLDDLEAVSNFISSSQYPNQQSVLDAELTTNTRALPKSSLIDLEALRGDRAQAEPMALAA